MSWPHKHCSPSLVPGPCMKYEIWPLPLWKNWFGQSDDMHECGLGDTTQGLVETACCGGGCNLAKLHNIIDKDIFQAPTQEKVCHNFPCVLFHIHCTFLDSVSIMFVH